MPKLLPSGFRVSRITGAEHAANQNGLHTFFGAMIGLVMAGTERLNGWLFAYVLMMVSGVVVCILYIAASRHRFLYSAMALAFAVLLPILVNHQLGSRGALPPKVQPTLIVWALMAIVVEFYPRERAVAGA